VHIQSVAVSIWHWILGNGGILTGVISGLFGVCTAHKTGRIWTLLAVGGVLGGMAWALLSSNYTDEQQKKQLTDEVNEIDAFVRGQSNEAVGQITANLKVEFAEYLGVRADLAQQTSPQMALALGAAGVEANELVAAVPADRRSLLTIRVFPHAQSQVNFTVVRARLGEMAANVQSDQTIEKSALTNSVWYSGGAQLSEAKAAALIATSAGLNIRQICTAKKVVNVPNLIQIGGSGPAEKLQVLTPISIQNMQQPVCVPGSGN
jgi:hypothetical protein